jgi:glycosyltransferase involved in cell wall biosynthesis
MNAAAAGQGPAPEVSVIVGVRNGAATLQRCLDSIASQDFASRETLVVDGASSDGTRELVERNARAGKVDWWVSEPDRGVYQAWNKAIRRSRGRWSCFLGCDDVFHDPGSLRALVEAGNVAGTRAHVVYGRIDRNAKACWWKRSGCPGTAREPFLRGVNILTRERCIVGKCSRRAACSTVYRIAGDHLLLGEFLERAPLS